MTDDDQDIFDSEANEAPQTTEGVSPEAPQPRDEQGKFASKSTGEDAPAALEPTVADGAPPAPAEKKSHDVPITALLDEREKRQRLEAELAELRRHLQSQQQPQPQYPDPVEDAEGYANHITQSLSQQFQAQLTGQTLKQSRFFAEKDYGKDAVEEAMNYFDQQPYAVSAQFLSSPSPLHAAVEWFQGQKQAQERSSPDYETKLREKIKAEVLAEMSQPSTRNVPKSLAEASSTGAPPPRPSDPLFS